jgi:hypothetical protein
MKSTEFCYWLQGWFEFEKPKQANEKQTKAIKEHLDLVFKYEKKPNDFCAFLKGYFVFTQPKMINLEQLILIQQELTNTFKNEIDSSYPPEQQKLLNSLHTEDLGKPRLESFC